MRVIRPKPNQSQLEAQKKAIKAQKDKKRKKINIIVGISMLLVGIALLVVGNFGHIQGLMSQYLQNQALSTKGEQKSKPNYNFSKVKPVSPATLAEAYKRRSNYKAVGQIAIPSLNINLNIYKGVGNDELNLGAGTMRPNEKMGVSNYCLAGHNMDDGKSYFSPLYSNYNRLIGRKIYLMNYYTVYHYTITKSQFITADRTDLLNPSKKAIISLFTCDYTGHGRLYVQGKYTGKKALNMSSKKIRNAFKK